jgi:hypothetical protein
MRETECSRKDQRDIRCKYGRLEGVVARNSRVGKGLQSASIELLILKDREGSLPAMTCRPRPLPSLAPSTIPCETSQIEHDQQDKRHDSTSIR